MKQLDVLLRHRPRSISRRRAPVSWTVSQRLAPKTGPAQMSEFLLLDEGGRRPAVSDQAAGAAGGRPGILPEVIAVGRSDVDRFRPAPGLNPGGDLTVDESALAVTDVPSTITLFMLRAETHRRRGEHQRRSQSAQHSAGPSFPHRTLLPRWQRA